MTKLSKALYTDPNDIATTVLMDNTNIGHHAIAFVKGWTRASAAFTATCILMDLGVEVSEEMKSTFSIIHGVVSAQYKSEADRINANRGQQNSTAAQ